MAYRLPTLPPQQMDDAIFVVALMLMQNLLPRSGYDDKTMKLINRRIRQILEYLNDLGPGK